MVEDRSHNRRSLQNMNKSQLARPRTGQENAWGVLHGTPTENSRVDHTENKRVIDSIPLNAVRAAAADVGADTAVPVADIAGAAAGVATDARAALAGAAADTAVVAADARAAALADAATDIAAAVDSAGDLYRRACHVRRHCGLHIPRSTRRFWL